MKNQARFTTLLSAPPAACLIASALLLSGCGTTSRDAGKTGGMVTSNTSASYIAALGGGVIGRTAGLSISKADRQRALEAEYRALEVARGGQPVVWEGSGISGSVVAAAPLSGWLAELPPIQPHGDGQGTGQHRARRRLP